jgi:hypothetical protein
MSDVLRAIEPHWYQDTQVSDDASVGLGNEPFGQGIPEMHDYVVRNLPDLRELRHA